MVTAIQNLFPLLILSALLVGCEGKQPEIQWFTHGLVPEVIQNESDGFGFENKKIQPPTVIQSPDIRQLIPDLTVTSCRETSYGLELELISQSLNLNQQKRLEIVCGGSSHSTDEYYIYNPTEQNSATCHIDIEDETKRRALQTAIAQFYQLPHYRNITLAPQTIFTDDDFCWTFLNKNEYPLAIRSALFRVDTEKPDQWWFEIRALGGVEWAPHISIEFTDFIYLWSWGHTHQLRQRGSHDDLQIRIPIFDIEMGQKILNGFREMHPNLPPNAIVDKTKGETLGTNLPRYRKSYLLQYQDVWPQLAKNAYIVDFELLKQPNDDQVGFGFENPDIGKWHKNLTALYQATLKTCPDWIGMSVMVPEEFQKPFISSGASKMFEEIDAPDGSTLFEAIDGKLPEGWIYFPLSPRWIAIIPSDAVVDDV